MGMSVADMVANLGEKTEWKVLQAAEDLGAMVSIKDVGPEKAGASETSRCSPRAASHLVKVFHRLNVRPARSGGTSAYQEWRRHRRDCSNTGDRWRQRGRTPGPETCPSNCVDKTLDWRGP